MVTKVQQDAVTCGDSASGGGGGITSKGNPCQRKTTNPSGLCDYHTGAGKVAAATAAIEHSKALAASSGLADGTPPDVVLPLPADGPPAGDLLGVPVMVADGEVEDSTLIAQRYLAGDDGHYDMLHLKLTPEGEAKMLDALGLHTTVTKLVTTDVETHGRHPLDTANDLFDKARQIVVSINARMKGGETQQQIIETNGPRLTALKEAFDVAANKAAKDDTGAQAMLAHYQEQIDTFEKYLDPDFSPPPYHDGGKIGQMNPWEGTHLETVTEEVVVPNPNVDDARLPTVEVTGKRIQPHLGADGRSRWDPSQMTSSRAPEKMWKIDLGDGYKALYYAQQHTQETAGYSMRRRMTVISPKGGTAADALERLEMLHINSAPMTADGAEFAYLERNLYARGLLDHPAVQNARVEGAVYAQNLAQKVVNDRISEAVGMDEDQTRAWVHSIRVTAEADALGYRAKRLRDAAAEAVGLPSGDALRSRPTYDPTPVRTRAGARFSRFTVDSDKSFDYSFSHNISGKKSQDGSLLAIIRNGCVLASQERRATMGTPKDLGMSESSDIASGGGSAVFLNGRTDSTIGGHLVWTGKQAEHLAARVDYYATPGDNYGATNPNDSHYTSSMTRDRNKILGMSTSEVMFESAIDLVAYPPTKIVAGSPSERTKVIAAFHKQGITHFSDGRTVEDVVV